MQTHTDIDTQPYRHTHTSRDTDRHTLRQRTNIQTYTQTQTGRLKLRHIQRLSQTDTQTYIKTEPYAH